MMMRNEVGNVNTCILDGENGTERARQLHQDRLLTRQVGGIAPERDNDLSDMSRVLDLASGPDGGWVLDVAYTHPKIEVIGVDRSPSSVRYSKAMAKVQGLCENAIFREMDILSPLEFPDASFDLVNARFLQGILPTPATWSAVVREALRVLRPGGILRVTEAELPVTNSPASQQLAALFTIGMQREGRICSCDNQIISTPSRVENLLRHAGFESIQQKIHAIDFSVGRDDVYEGMRQNITIGIAMALPFLLRTKVVAEVGGVLSQEEFDVLAQQAECEMLDDTFSGRWDIVTAWGSKSLILGSSNVQENTTRTFRGAKGEAVYA